MFLLCFFQAFLAEFLLSMTKWKISWTDAPFRGQDLHSNFFSRSNIWPYGSLPLGASAAVDMPGCLVCFAAVELHLKLFLA